MAVFYIQSTSPCLSQYDYIILVIWVLNIEYWILNIFMLFLCCHMFILHHLARQCPPRTTEWGWVCPWSNWAPQMLPSFSHSCWSGFLPERSVTIRRNCNKRKNLNILPWRWGWCRWPVECRTRTRGYSCPASNRPPRPGTLPPRVGSGARRELKEVYMWDFQKGF